MSTESTKSREGAEAEAVAEQGQDEAFARKIVTVLSRGNVSLQVDKFQTEAQLAARRDALKKYDFLRFRCSRRIGSLILPPSGRRRSCESSGRSGSERRSPFPRSTN